MHPGPIPADTVRDMSSAPAGRPGRDTPREEDGASVPLQRMRRTAAVILGLEALALVGLASFTFLDVATAPELPARFVIALGVFFLVFALLLAVATSSVLRGHRFGVGYGMTWQLFQALVGGSLLSAGLLLPAAFALLLSVAGFLVLFRLMRHTPTPLELD